MTQKDALKKSRSTALWKYIQSGNLGVVRVLLEGGADPNQLNSFQEPPLISAIKERDIRIAALLLEFGADPWFRSEYGWTPLMIAEFHRLDEIVELLKPYCQKETTDEATMQHDIRWAQFIRNISSGDEPGVIDFIASGIEPDLCDFYGASALVLSMKKNHFQFAPLLIDVGANISAKNPYDGMTPLLYTSLTGNIPMMDYLIYKGASLQEINIEGENALTLCIVNHHNETVAHLLKQGVSPDERIGKSRHTPLMHAAYTGNLEAVEMLLRFGAEVNLEDTGGMTALHYAAAHPKSPPIVTLLAEEGANIEAKADGFTPLMWCILNENFATADALLQYGASLNPGVEQADNRSFLNFLCQIGDKEIKKIDYLLKNGARPSVVDLDESRQALYCPRQKQNGSDRRINELLKRYGF